MKNTDIDIERLKQVTYDKEFECPVCSKIFKSKVIKTGKNRTIHTDIDLKSEYDIVDPLIYDIMHCSCGYTAMSKTFNKLTKTPVEKIRRNVCERYKEIPIGEFRSVKDAIFLYKIGIVNALAKDGSTGEYGMLCLRLGWLYRDLDDTENEMKYLSHANEKLSLSLQDGSYNKVGLDDNTLLYLISAINYKLGLFDESLKTLSSIVGRYDIPPRIKQKAIDLKYAIREEKDKLNTAM